MIEIDEARRLLFAEVAPLGVEEVPLGRARGRVLAESVEADRDFPATDRSAMDGYAVRSADLPEPGRTLRVVGEVPAGSAPGTLGVGPGQAVRIFTGGVVPAGADAVVMVELTSEDRNAGTVQVRQRAEAWQNVRRCGEDLRRGETILEPGRRVGPAEVAALASVGRVRVRVHRRPVVQVLSTGDEIVEPGDRPAPHQIRNSNAPMLLALLEEVGIEGAYLGIARDRRDALDPALARGLAGDVLLVTGGVSVGAYDLVRASLERAGMRPIFHRVAMKPGKPILAGRAGACLVLGLPGNPVSTFTGFHVFAAPVLRRLLGLAAWDHVPETAVLAERLRRKPGRTTYHLARVSLEDGRRVVRPVKTMSSGDVLSMVRANAFAVTPGSPRALEPGTEVPVLLWPGADPPPFPGRG